MSWSFYKVEEIIPDGTIVVDNDLTTVEYCNSPSDPVDRCHIVFASVPLTGLLVTSLTPEEAQAHLEACESHTISYEELLLGGGAL